MTACKVMAIPNFQNFDPISMGLLRFDSSRFSILLTIKDDNNMDSLITSDRFTFGRHRGQLIRAASSNYLEWVLSHVRGISSLERRAIVDVLESRGIDVFEPVRATEKASLRTEPSLAVPLSEANKVRAELGLPLI